MNLPLKSGGIARVAVQVLSIILGLAAAPALAVCPTEQDLWEGIEAVDSDGKFWRFKRLDAITHEERGTLSLEGFQETSVALFANGLYDLEHQVFLHEPDREPELLSHQKWIYVGGKPFEFIERPIHHLPAPGVGEESTVTAVKVEILNGERELVVVTRRIGPAIPVVIADCPYSASAITEVYAKVDVIAGQIVMPDDGAETSRMAFVWDLGIVLWFDVEGLIDEDLPRLEEFAASSAR